MPAKPLIVVVGSDGFVGGRMAETLQARRVVYGRCQDGDTHATNAQSLLSQADVVINAGGFRLRPGLTLEDYRRSHQGATSAIVPWVRKGALFIHMSSAAVFGRSLEHKLGNHTSPDPKSFPSPSYALAKYEADQFLEKAAAEAGFRLVFLRPGVLYAPQTDGMLDSLVKLAKRGILLGLRPRDGRQHLCDIGLLIEVVTRVISANDLPPVSSFVIADPLPVTNRELEAMIRRNLQRKLTTIPLPLTLLSSMWRHSFHSRNPRFDLATWGEILGVMDLDTVYETTDTFRRLAIDPSHYLLDKTLEPLIRQALQQ
ncbi:MAG TPA: NAD-dependent epimerase/dehydratase family protein [Candidatus Acidoferrum sp.]|nr:NAD-dependent epimerase/dehydratase family protein [Candidatus Acidoferrum sp.]